MGVTSIVMLVVATLAVLLISGAAGYWDDGSKDPSYSNLEFYAMNMTCNDERTTCQTCFTSQSRGKSFLHTLEYSTGPYVFKFRLFGGAQDSALFIVLEDPSEPYRLCSTYDIIWGVDGQWRLDGCVDTRIPSDLAATDGCAEPIALVTVYSATRNYKIRGQQGRLPLRWMAPESLVDGVYTTQSDVWSFGVLLWEIVTLGDRPYPGMSAKKMPAQIQEGYRMPKPDQCHETLYQMMLACWMKEPKDRLTFKKASRKLERLLSVSNEYITMEVSQESPYEMMSVPTGAAEKI